MTTFVHTIGGYYRDRKKFIKESREFGVNRRIAVHLLKGFSFGDVVVVLDWNKGEPEAYGQFTVDRLAFQEAVMTALMPRLIEEGQADERPAYGPVVRECGSYVDTGGVTLRPNSPLTLQDLLARAKAIAAELGLAKLETFIGGTFQAYAEPFALDEAPPFQMGYWKVNDEVGKRVRTRGAREAHGIGTYALRDRKARQNEPVLHQSI